MFIIECILVDMHGEIPGGVNIHVWFIFVICHVSCDQPNAKLQAELFSQLSESFLLLILNVSQKHKDEFFKVEKLLLCTSIVIL